MQKLRRKYEPHLSYSTHNMVNNKPIINLRLFFLTTVCKPYVMSNECFRCAKRKIDMLICLLIQKEIQAFMSWKTFANVDETCKNLPQI